MPSVAETCAVLTLVTPPSGRVVSIDAARTQCRISHFEEDALLDLYAAAAVARCEDVTGRQLLTATYELQTDFPSGPAIVLPRPPLQAVTSITYVDAAGDEQTLPASDYVVHAPSGARPGFGRVTLAAGKSWPLTLSQPGAVRVRFVAGYGADGASVPASIVQGVMLTIGTWFTNREDVVVGGSVQATPLAAKQLWRPFYVR